MDKTYSKIFKITKKGKSNVYDFTVDETHRILANNFYTSNCHVKHPDAEDFIDAKMTQGKVTGANVSVKLDDEFMKCVIEEKPYIQKYPIDSDNPIFTKEIDAKKLWKKIIYNAWKCVPYDTEIPVYDNNNIYSIKKIGDVVKNKDKYKVLSVNLNNLKIEKKSIIDHQEYNNDKEIYEIITKKGKSVIATKDHVVYLLKNEKVESVPISSTNIGDYLIVSNKIRLDDDDYCNKIKLDLSYFRNFSISFDNFENELKNNKEVETTLGFYDKSSKLSHYLSKGRLPIKYYSKISDLIDVSNPIIMNDNVQIEQYYNIDDNVSSFLGLWLAEGSYHNNSVLIHINTNELDSYLDLFNYISNKFKCNFNVKKDGNYTVVTFFSSFFTNFMKSIGMIYINKNKTIPKWLFSSQKNIIGSFLKGLFSGDGTTNKNVISLSQSNYEIINNVSNLLLMFGIHSKISLTSESGKKMINNKYTNVKKSYRLSIYKENNYIFENNISFFIDSKKIKNFNVKVDSFTIPLSKEKMEKMRMFGKETTSKNLLLEKLKIYNNISINNKIIDNDVNYDKIISVKKINQKIDKVYDITVEDNHTFILSNGCLISNSAEPGLLFWDTVIKESVPDCYTEHGFKTVSTNPCGEIPLNVGDSCRLLALNLYSYVENPFTKDAKFNYDLFKEHVIYAQRFMDDIVDLEIEKIDQILNKIDNDPEPEHIKRVERELWKLIKDNAVKGRRTGLGITSEGDMIAAMGLIYGTSEATDFAENIHKILATYAYKSSIIMAEERGSFTVFNKDNEKNNPFVNRVLNSLKEFKENDIIEKYNKTGRRNISLLTIAPTGSVSIVTQTTSGIEPVFLPSYTRRRKINPNDKNTKTAFIDEVGDHWEEYNVFHHKFKTWAEINGYDTSKLETMKQSELDDIIKKSPYFKATSNDVNWVEKVRMQGKIQKWVDHSISVTINLPSDVNEELVSQVYQTGWESGCKGITVYRDGSRSGVLITKADNKKANIFQENNAPKRPESLQCDVYRFQNKGDKWIGFMGLLDNKPYEIFTGLQESVNIPNNITKGEIKKVKSAESDGHSRYDFIYIDKDGYKQEFRGLSRAFNREFWNTGRLISAVLRHGMPLPNVLQIMDKLIFDSDDVITSWKQGIKRIIKKYIKEGTLVKGQTCDVCGSSNIVFKEGCMTCMDCGTSKCE